MSTSPNIQLGSLDFNEVKNSIIDYLKTQDTLKDYDYAGSAVQVLLDILAYNTMYYGHYSNMIATEMFLDSAQRLESIISLVKPLGYVVPGKTSATAVVVMTSSGHANASIPRYSRFSGTNADGIPYTFYTTGINYFDGEGSATVTVTEAKHLLKELPLIIDQNTQKSFLLGLDIDIKTVRVEVKNSDTGEWTEWDKVDNIQAGLDNKSKVYWLERSELGFFVVFGGNVGTVENIQVGLQIIPSDEVRVSYIKSNGEEGNNIGNFNALSYPLSDNTTFELSSGGTNEPNIEMIRFFAPKWFAAQDRAITVEDCRALLASSGFVGDSPDPFTKINVWGGETMTPPMYGRVFISINDESSSSVNQQAEVAMSILLEKTCVSILPEFMNPDYFEVILRGMIFWDPLSTPSSSNNIIGLAKKAVLDNFPSRFENTFKLSEISNIVNNSHDSIVSNPSDFSITIRKEVDLNQLLEAKTLHFKHELLQSSFATSEFIAGGIFDNVPDGQKIRLRTTGTVNNNIQELEGYYYTDEGLLARLSGAGIWNSKEGIVIINPQVAAEPFNVEVVPLNSIFKGNENIVSSAIVELTLESIN